MHYMYYIIIDVKCIIFQPVISLEVIFPQDYPMSPPFVRVVKPRFEFLTGMI
jgi:ubiquitin-protein ligase